MSLLTNSSPHAHKALDTAGVMRWVLLATLPGIAALTAAFGWGTLVNIVVVSIFSLLLESLVLLWRKRPVGFYLRDYSALVTAVLLGIALPPYAPWWLLLVGAFFAIVLAKQLYGGLGYNPFNPAMVAYVALLISFPVPMTTWAAPLTLLPEGASAPSLLDTLALCFGLTEHITIDGLTMATPLDLLRQNNSLMIAELRESNVIFGRWGGLGWEWVNLAFLAGGVLLLTKRIYTWHAPVAMLSALLVMSAIFYDGGSADSIGSPLMQLFSGATMLGAWFIITDPVSSAVSNRGRLIYGAGAGILLYTIRKWGNYPDAVAFAVLLMNFAAPFIDHYTQPRVYGNSGRGQ